MKTYQEIRDEFDSRRKSTPWVASIPDLETYSTLMEGMFPGQYQQGLGGRSTIKDLSLAFDSALDYTGLPQLTGEVMGVGSSIFGEKGKQIGYEIGKGFPRLGAELGMLALGPFGWAGALTSAGSRGYTESGDALGAGMGIASLLAPIAGGAVARNLAASAVMKNFGRALTVPEELLALNTGSILALEGNRQVEGTLRGGSPFTGELNPFTEENILSNLIGNVPFAVRDVATMAFRGRKVDEPKRTQEVPFEKWWGGAEGEDGATKPSGPTSPKGPTSPTNPLDLVVFEGKSQAAQEHLSRFYGVKRPPLVEKPNRLLLEESPIEVEVTILDDRKLLTYKQNLDTPRLAIQDSIKAITDVINDITNVRGLLPEGLTQENINNKITNKLEEGQNPTDAVNDVITGIERKLVDSLEEGNERAKILKEATEKDTKVAGILDETKRNQLFERLGEFTENELQVFNRITNEFEQTHGDLPGVGTDAALLAMFSKKVLDRRKDFANPKDEAWLQELGTILVSSMERGRFFEKRKTHVSFDEKIDSVDEITKKLFAPPEVENIPKDAKEDVNLIASNNLLNKIAEDLQVTKITTKFLGQGKKNDSPARLMAYVKYMLQSFYPDVDAKTNLQELADTLKVTPKTARDYFNRDREKILNTLKNLPSFQELGKVLMQNRMAVGKSSSQVSDFYINALMRKMWAVGVDVQRNSKHHFEQVRVLASKFAEWNNADKPTADLISKVAVKMYARMANMMPKTLEFRLSEELDQVGIAGLMNQGDKTSTTLLEVNPNLSVSTFLEVFGHELYHALEQSWMDGKLQSRHKKVLDEAYDFIDRLSEDGRYELVKTIAMEYGDLYTKKRDMAYVQEMAEQTAEYAKQSPSETLATINGFLLQAEAAKSNRHSTFPFLPKPIVDFAMTIYEFGIKTLDVIQRLIYGEHRGILPKTEAATTAENVQRAKKLFAELYKKSPLELSAEKMMVEFASSLPENYIQTRELVGQAEMSGAQNATQFHTNISPMVDIWKSLAGLGKDAEAEKLFGRRPGALSSLLPMHFFRKIYPELNAVVDAGWSMTHVARQIGVKIAGPLVGRDGKNLEKVYTNPKLVEVVNELAYRQQRAEKSLTPEEIAKFGEERKLTQEQIDSIQQLFRDVKVSMRNSVEEMKKFAGATAKHTITAVFRAHIPDAPTKQIEQLGEEVYSGLIVNDMQKVQNALKNLPQDKQAPLLKESMESINKMNELFKSLENRDWYWPESMKGRYGVNYVGQDGKKKTAIFKKQSDLQEWLRENKNKTILRVFDKADAESDLKFASDRTVNAVKEIEQRLKEMATKLVDDKETLSALKEMLSVGDVLQRELQARTYKKHFIHRKGKVENVNYLDTLMDYVESLSSGMARQFTKELANIRLDAPELKANPALRMKGRQYIESLLHTRDNEYIRAGRSLGFYYYLALNPSSMVVEGAQSLFTLAPWLTSQGARLGEGYAIIRDAAQMLTHARLKDGKYQDAQIDKLVKKAIEDGVVESGIWEQLHEVDGDLDFLRFRQRLVGVPAVDNATALAMPLVHILRFGKHAYRSLSIANSEISFVSGILLGRKKGLEGEQLYSFARDAVQTAAMTGGKAARPMFYLSPDNRAHSVLGTAYVLGHFMHSMIGTYVYYGNAALGRLGLTKEQTQAARKALAQAAATQFIAAGVRGLPLVGISIAVLEQLFPDLELKKNGYEMIKGLFQDDEKMGNIVADAAMNGMISAITPVDVSARYSLNTILGFDAYKGFDMATLAGPVGGVFQNLIRGGQQVYLGDYAKGAQTILPVFAKQTVNMLANNGEVRNSRGELLYQPTQAENIIRFLGFNPSNVRRIKEREELLQRSERISRDAESRFVDELAELLVDNRPQEVRKILLKRFQEEPLFDINSALARAAQKATDRQFVKDPRRTRGAITNVDARKNIIGMYNISQKDPTEVDRYMQQKAYEASVGIIGAGQVTRRGLSRAQAIDRLMAMYPTITRQEAIRLVDQMQ